MPHTYEKIYSLVAEGYLGELGSIINSIASLNEKYFVHMAFFDKYGVGYETKILKMTKSYEELKIHGLI